MDKYVSDVVKLQDDPIWEHLETIEGECKDKTVYSASRLDTFARCGWQGKLKFIDKIPEETRNLGAVCGRGIHKAIHRVHSENLWSDAPDMFDDEWETVFGEEGDKRWFGNVTEEKIRTAHGDFKTMFVGYCDRNGPGSIGNYQIYTELPFRGILKHPRTQTRYRVAGTLDQVRQFDSGFLNVTDIKSNKAKPNERFLMLSKQYGLYGWALKHAVFVKPDGKPLNFGRYPDELIWYHLRNLLPYKRGGTASDGTKFQKGDLRGDPRIPVLRTPDAYDFLCEQICRLIQMIRFRLFTQAEGSIECSMCRVSHACTAGALGSREDDIALADLDSFYEREGK